MGESPQPGPRQRAELVGDDVGVERLAPLDEAPAGRLRHADDGVGERELVVGVEADVDERGDRVGRLGSHPAHRLGELGVDTRAATEQQDERLAVVSDPAEIGAEPPLGALATVLRRRSSLW